jgi:hypothetical protein
LGRNPEGGDFLGRLEFAAADGAIGFPVLWDRARQQAEDDIVDGQPAWSPDGRKRGSRRSGR